MLDKMGIHERSSSFPERFTSIATVSTNSAAATASMPRQSRHSSTATARSCDRLEGEQHAHNGTPELTDAESTCLLHVQTGVFIDKIVKYFDIAQYFTVLGATLMAIIGTKAGSHSRRSTVCRCRSSQAVLVCSPHDVEGAKQWY